MSVIADIFIRYTRTSLSPRPNDLKTVSPIPSDIVASIGQTTSLRIAQPLATTFDFRGYCLGSAITMISCLLNSPLPFREDDILDVYRTQTEKVISLQQLQDSLAASDCRFGRKELAPFVNLLAGKKTSDKKISKLSAEAQILFSFTQEFLTRQEEGSLRKYLIEEYEAKKGSIRQKPYALALEISGIYDKLHRPESHRFHALQRDILRELTSLCGFQATELVAEYGNENTLADRLFDMPSGVYYVSFSRHSFAVLREEGQFLWLWNSAKGFKQFEMREKEKKLLAKSLRGCYTTKTNWITVSKCT